MTKKFIVVEYDDSAPGGMDVRSSIEKTLNLAALNAMADLKANVRELSFEDPGKALPRVDEFVGTVARMKLDGEPLVEGGEGFEMSAEDAISTLDDLIQSARTLELEGAVATMVLPAELVRRARDLIATAMEDHIYDAANGEQPPPDCPYASFRKDAQAYLAAFESAARTAAQHPPADMADKDVRVTVTAEDPAYGDARVVLGTGQLFEWGESGAGDAQYVWFEVLDRKGGVVEDFALDGSTWDAFERNGGMPSDLDGIVAAVRAGQALEDAVTEAMGNFVQEVKAKP